VSFRDVLQGIRDRVEGTLAVSLIGLDGISVEKLNGDDVPLDVMGAEFGSFIKSVRLSNTELNTGEILQFSLVTEKYIAFVSEVTPEYYVLLVLRPDGNYGRARFELTRAKQLLRDELT
jgi:predicted regulator of Ras-like GTPase activity (Roadblock/LC7/MglB family)